jgi:anti-sigma B factor antagonist
METAIGVFTSRQRAEEAIKELRGNGVPDDSIIFLSRAEHESTTASKDLGTTVGGLMGAATGMTAGVAAATLLVVPGIGQVVALGLGGAALAGLLGAGVGSKAGEALAEAGVPAEPTSNRDNPEEAHFFREVLRSGRSLIIVRTDSHSLAETACSILDRVGVGMRGHVPVKMETGTRQVVDTMIVDVSGRITLGEDNLLLRDIVSGLLEQGHKKILLNLQNVGYIDSCGMGELVRAFTSIRKQGGTVKLVSPSRRVFDMLEMTKLSTVLEIEADETTAIQSLRKIA